jgi:DNA invertase Pin-like site-specific DNA recombinase
VGRHDHPHGKLMITILGGLAEFERSLILARTSEGRARAQARGVAFDRKPKLTRHQRREALAHGRRENRWPKSVGATTLVTRRFHD